MAAGAKIAKPMRSSLAGSVRRTDIVGGLGIWSGTWENASNTATKPPMGRLM